MIQSFPNRYTIRQKVLKLMGAAFFIHDEQGELIGYCKQKAFRLKEDIRVYTDRTESDQLMSIRARSIVDLSATYDIFDENALQIGSAKRKGVRSLVRDEWTLFDEDGREIAKLSEDSTGMALARRFLPLVAWIAPQTFELRTDEGSHIASFQTQRNVLVYKLAVTAHETSGFDPRLVMALGFLIAAIEGRQSSGSSGSGVFSGG